MVKTASLITALLFVVPARATVQVNIQQSFGGFSTQELETLVARELNEVFNLIDPQQYLERLADAQAFSVHGLGVDYVSNPSAFIFGAAVNGSLTLGDLELNQSDSSDPPFDSIGANVTIMAGLNLDLVGIPGLMVYANFFNYSVDIDDVTASIRNIGLHGQYTFFRPDGDPSELLFRWGGVSVTSGLQVSSLSVSLEQPLETDLPLEGGLTAIYDGTGTLDVTTDVVAIPVEVTTNARLLYILGLYAGFGFDIQLGSSDLNIGLNGPLRGRDGSNNEVSLGSAEVTANESGDPSTGTFRFLLGTQINIAVLKVFAQANFSPQGAISAAAGVRVAW